MKKARIIAFLLTMCMATACFLSGTVAKYESSADGTGKGDIAEWAFEVNDASITENAATFNFTLSDTIKEADGAANETDSSNKIAPGTSGTFTIKLENTSEVSASYTISFADAVTGGAEIPLTYTVNDGTNDLVESTGVFASTTNLAADGSVTLTVTWVWAYETVGGDAVDTEIGIAATGTEDLTITATVTATQED